MSSSGEPASDGRQRDWMRTSAAKLMFIRTQGGPSCAGRAASRERRKFSRAGPLSSPTPTPLRGVHAAPTDRDGYRLVSKTSQDRQTKAPQLPYPLTSSPRRLNETDVVLRPRRRSRRSVSKGGSKRPSLVFNMISHPCRFPEVAVCERLTNQLPVSK